MLFTTALLISSLRFCSDRASVSPFITDTLKDCRAIKMKGMVLDNTWVYSKEDTMAHTYRPVVFS